MYFGHTGFGIGPIHALFLSNCLYYHMFECVKDTSHRDGSFTCPKLMFDGEKLIIIIFEGYNFMSLSLSIVLTTENSK